MTPAKQKEVSAWLTFNTPPTSPVITQRAALIAQVAAEVPECNTAMIGGALWLMAPLTAALRERGIEPVFAFSVRDTEEQKQPDGSIRKTTVFRHAGFVPAWLPTP